MSTRIASVLCGVVLLGAVGHARADETPQQAMAAAMARFNAGDLRAAARLLAAAAARLPAGTQRARAYLHEGLALAYLGRKDDARRAFTLALAEDPAIRVDRERVPPESVALFDGVVRERSAARVGTGSGPGARVVLPLPAAKRIHVASSEEPPSEAPSAWRPRVGLALGFGATLGSSGGPTNATGSEVDRALFFAPAHLALEGSYFVTPRFEIGLALRIQLTEATVGVEPHVRYTFGDGVARFYLQAGLAVLRITRETDVFTDFFGESRDTLTTGTVGPALGLGVLWALSRHVGLSVGASFTPLLPDAALLVDFGLRVRARF